MFACQAPLHNSVLICTRGPISLSPCLTPCNLGNGFSNVELTIKYSARHKIELRCQCAGVAATAAGPALANGAAKLLSSLKYGQWYAAGPSRITEGGTFSTTDADCHSGEILSLLSGMARGPAPRAAQPG
jgi:hypothetical protein